MSYNRLTFFSIVPNSQVAMVQCASTRLSRKNILHYTNCIKWLSSHCLMPIKLTKSIENYRTIDISRVLTVRIIHNRVEMLYMYILSVLSGHYVTDCDQRQHFYH